MPQTLDVYALPKFADPKTLAGGTAVVVDVLRASTTIVHALEAGAHEVLPCLEINEARAMARRLGPGECLLAGERQGRPIEGFDLGNSPEEFTPERIGGRSIVFTTTNGTRAISAARSAERVLIGAFVNAQAVCNRLLGVEHIHILCAGTNDQFSSDDTLLAGLLVERLQRLGGMSYQLNAQAMTAQEYWLHAFALPQVLGAEPLEPERLAESLYESPGGKQLTALGMDEDILAAAQIDRFASVPQLDPASFSIRLAGS